MLVFAVPTVLLRPHVDAVRGRTASALRDGLAGLVAPFLRSVGDGLLDGTVREHDRDLGESVVDLVRGLLAGRAEDARRPDLLAEIKATIELRLHEPDLRPATIAAAHFISTRYLHRLFEPEGVSVSEWIRLRRLERCRRDLEDPALADETVTAIARRWGLPNPGHFSRLFHAAYGMLAQRCARACKRSSLTWQTARARTRTVGTWISGGRPPSSPAGAVGSAPRRVSRWGAQAPASCWSTATRSAWRRPPARSPPRAPRCGRTPRT